MKDTSLISKRNEEELMRRVLLILVLVVAAAWLGSVLAQPATCTVSTTFYNFDSTPNPNATLTVFKVELNGSVISSGPRLYRVNASGQLLNTDNTVGMKLPRNSVAWIYADAPGFNEDSATGTPLVVPDAPTANLESLQLWVQGTFYVTATTGDAFTLRAPSLTTGGGFKLIVPNSGFTGPLFRAQKMDGTVLFNIDSTGVITVGSIIGGGGGGGGAIAIREVDGTPLVSSATILEVDQTDGLVGTNPSGTTFRLDLAGVPYSVLSLNNSILNADINASAGIAYSKLNLAGAIVNADLATGAAIAFSKLAALTVNRALVSDGSGVITVSAVTATELGHVAGVTSAIQTQLNGKVPTSRLLTGGVGIGAIGDLGLDRVISFDATELAGLTWGDGSQANYLWTFSLSGATDPVWTISNNSMDLSIGVLKQGGTLVVLETRSLIGGTGIGAIGNLSTDRTINVDTTEIATTTWGGGTGFNWTFDTGATDPVVAFSSGVINISTGALQVGGIAVSLVGHTHAASDIISGIIAISRGGTGTGTSPSDGKLLIGKTDGTYAVANLIAGSNVTITNGDGTISISSSGGASGYATVAEEGSALTQRSTLNFAGSGITAADNPGQSRTDVTLNAQLNSLADLATNGLIARTAANTLAAISIVDGVGIAVTNGNGVSGDPSVAWDPATFVANITFWDSSQASRSITAGLSGVNDPVITFLNSTVNISTGILQVGGTTVVLESRTLTGGVAIVAIGDLSTNRTIDFDLTELTEETSIAAGDFVIIYDVSASAHRKMTRSNFVSGIGGGSLPVLDTTSIVEGSADGGKEIRFEVDGFAAAVVHVLTPQDADYILAGVNISQTFTAAQGISSNSASSFFVGPNGDTNPVFRVVGNVVGAATGISVTGRAAGAGVDITVLSSGANESLSLVPKGTGVVLLPGGAQNAPGIAFTGDTDLGIFRRADNVMDFVSNNQIHMEIQPTFVGLRNDVRLGWTSGEASTSPDVAFARVSAGIVKLSDGSTGFGRLSFGTDVHDLAGSGSPEGVVTANIGSIYRRTNGGQNIAVYVKTSGTGNTGWEALLNTAAGGSSAWSSLTAPSGALSLSMGTHITTFTWATGTSSSNLFNFTTAASADGTGYLVNIDTGSGSTVKPFRVGRVGSDVLTISNAGVVALTLGSDATGDLFYRNSSGNLERLAIGATDAILTVAGGVPAWVTYVPTKHMVALNNFTIPDSSGNVFLEPYPIKATNDFWKSTVYIFNDTATDDYLYGQFRVPDDYVGTAKIVITWTTTATTDDVRWEFAYRAVGGDDAESLDQSTAQETVTQADTAPSAANEKMTITIDLTSSNFAPGDIVTWRLGRTGTNAGDTLAAAAQLWDLRFQYKDR